MTAVEEWPDRFGELVIGGPDVDEGGAELVVEDPDGTVAFRAPLARMWRHEPDTKSIWIRPIIGGHQDYPGAPWRFSISNCRRRGLKYLAAAIHGDRVVLDLWNGQRARVQPVNEDLRGQLERWDTFVLTQMSAEAEAALEALAEDSWYGEWS